MTTLEDKYNHNVKLHSTRWDTVESPAFLAALSDSLDKSLDVLAAQLKATLFSEPVDSSLSPAAVTTTPTVRFVMRV